MMKFTKTIIALSSSLFFISCGDNTLGHITSDVQKIEIDQNEVTSIYSTDETSLSSTVFYMDGISADVTYNVSWENSDYNITTLNKNILIPIVNNGEADISIAYKGLSDKIRVNIVGLKDINSSWGITSTNITTTGEFALAAEGNFTDGENNKPLLHNIQWFSSNETDIMTLNDDYSVTLTIESFGDRNITARLFDNNNTDKTISYSISE